MKSNLNQKGANLSSFGTLPPDFSALRTLLVIIALIGTSRLQASVDFDFQSTFLKVDCLSEHAGISGQAFGLESANHGFVNAGRHLSKPIINSIVQGTIKKDGLEGMMPILPAGLLAVLIGFLCISLVRDRDIWIAVLSAVLCFNHFSVSEMPRAAKYINFKSAVLKNYPQEFSFNKNNLTSLAKCSCDKSNAYKIFSVVNDLPQLINLNFLSIKTAVVSLVYSPFEFIYNNLCRAPPL